MENSLKLKSKYNEEINNIIRNLINSNQCKKH